MHSNFKTTLDNLSSNLLELDEEKGIRVAPLNKLVEELKEQAQDILAIENQIESVQRAVIEPIRKDLEENRAAGQFSRFGFYLGALGFIVTGISLFFSIDFSAHDVKPFVMGKRIEASRQQSLLVEGDIDCVNNWICLVNDQNKVWPQINILPSDLSNDMFRRTIDLPDGFAGGKVVLACVPNSIHDIYRVRQGGPVPVKIPAKESHFQVLRESYITLK